MVDSTTLPPSSLLLAYWMAGAFLMGAKRLSEYSEIRATSGIEMLTRYRRSWPHILRRILIISCFLYAMIAAFAIAVFLVKYRIEYVLAFPFIASMFAVYLWLAFRTGSVVQRPEQAFSLTARHCHRRTDYSGTDFHHVHRRAFATIPVYPIIRCCPFARRMSNGMVTTPLDWDSIDLVVFDLNGTLYDQRRLRARMLLQILRHTIRSKSLRLARIIRTFRQCREDLSDKPTDDFLLRQYEITAARHSCSVKEVRELVSEWIERRPLSVIGGCRYTGVEQLFKALASSSRTVAVLSDYPAEAKLRALGLKADVVVSSTDEDVGRLKPDPTGLYKVLKLAGVEPQRSLMIGDRFDRDGEVARRVGMRALIKSNLRENEVDKFSSYTDDIFRPLFQTELSGDRPPPDASFDRRNAVWQNLKEKAVGYTVVGGLTAILDLLASAGSTISTPDFSRRCLQLPDVFRIPILGGFRCGLSQGVAIAATGRHVHYRQRHWTDGQRDRDGGTGKLFAGLSDPGKIRWDRHCILYELPPHHLCRFSQVRRVTHVAEF